MKTRTFARVGLATLALAGQASMAGAKEPLVEVDWSRTTPLSGQVVDGSVELVAEQGGGMFPLVAIDRPPVGGPGYVLSGEVRYEDVAGRGFLEMWSVFPDGRYFSRTLDAGGPLAALSGDSDWREFRLPFYLNGEARPTRLEVNLVLPGAGRVWVGPVRLDPLGADVSSGWWSDRGGGLVGGISGGTVGVLGAILGALVGARRARRFALAAMLTLAVIGAGSLVAGAVALALSQPYAVYFPLLLIGVILVGVFVPGRRNARRLYEEAELRRMRAMDVAGKD